MAKEEISRTGILQELQKIALSRPNAGVELAYMERPTKQMIRRLDLSAISEFKRNSAGSVEIRFIDRVKALQALYELLGSGSDEEEMGELRKGGERVTEQDLSLTLPMPKGRGFMVR